MIEPVQLLVFVLQQDSTWNAELKDMLTEHWGPIRHWGAWQPFDQTNYYTPEMGASLYRSVLSFEKLIDPADIAKIKLQSIALEKQFGTQGRKYNLDFGYMDADKIVLPSCKKGPWKVYVGEGIWLDMVLHYAKGEFTGTPWSFEDFRRNPYQRDLQLIREKYRKVLKRMTSGTDYENPPRQ